MRQDDKTRQCLSSAALLSLGSTWRHTTTMTTWIGCLPCSALTVGDVARPAEPQQEQRKRDPCPNRVWQAWLWRAKMPGEPGRIGPEGPARQGLLGCRLAVGGRPQCTTSCKRFLAETRHAGRSHPRTRRNYNRKNSRIPYRPKIRQ